MALEVRPLSDELSFGARVRGVSSEAVVDPALREQLRELFKDKAILVFEDMEPTARMQVELSKVFGPLKDHPTKFTARTAEDEAHGVIDMHYMPNDASTKMALVEIDGKVLARFAPWHFDHCYNDELNYAGVLRCPVNPPEGGRTGFMDGVELYRQFPKAMRERLETMNIIYTLDTRYTKMRFGVNFTPIEDAPEVFADLLKEVAIFPRAIHPAVWTCKNGEKSLHVSPWMAVGIENHEDAEGDAFLDEVCHELNRLGLGTSAYWHEWKPNDMVIWDNHRMLHAVEGCDAQYERHTIRSTIQGDYGLGYFEGGKKIGEVFREVA
jgi:taurine dioxygenase